MPLKDDERLIQQILSGEEYQVNSTEKELYEREYNKVLEMILTNEGSYQDTQLILRRAIKVVIQQIQKKKKRSNFNVNVSKLINATAKRKWSDEKIIRKIKSEDQRQINSAITELRKIVLNKFPKVVFQKKDIIDDLDSIFNIAVIALITKIKNGIYRPYMSDLTTYIIAIMSNKISDKYNFRDRNNTVPFDENDPTLTATQYPDFDGKFSQEDKDKIFRLINQLGKKCKEILTWRHTKGYSLKAFTERNPNISYDAIKQRHKRCMDKLKEKFNGNNSGIK